MPLLSLTDRFLNTITMYKVVLYCLIILATISVVFGFFGILPFSGISFLFSLGLLFVSCYLTQIVCDKLFHAVSNTESYAITSLILFFVLSPILETSDIPVTLAAGIIAIISKYVLAVEKKHLFNPVAISVVILGLFGFGNAIWWVGSSVMLPFTLIIGFLIVRKIRRFHLAGMFLLLATISTVLFNYFNNIAPDQSVRFLIFSSPLIFFGSVMLTEPLTTPPGKKRYMTYAGIVGLLYGSQFHIGPFFASPELALVLGNVLSYLLSPKKKLFVHVKKINKLSSDIYEFVFAKTQLFSFIPGQYLEWTVGHAHVDTRGNRRYFTIASSPTEPDIRLGVKMAKNGSSFKKALVNLSQTSPVIGGQLSGDFVLPENKHQKLVFIAGGIGITPFRSMVKYLLDIKEKRDVVLFYTAASPDEFVYKDVFSEAERRFGFKTVYVITNPDNAPADWKGSVGYLTPELVKQHISDFRSRTYYLSGPNRMIESYKKLLSTLGIPFNKIVTDYFPGF